MKKFSGVVAVCLAVVAGAAVAADAVKSGLAEGVSPPAFNVRDITGPQAGETLCYRCKYGARPVVTIFTREMNENVTDLIKKIDAKVGANKDAKMAAFVVFLADDDTISPKIEAIAKENDIKNTPLTLIEGNGPPKYNLSKDAAVTVMMWVDGELKVNEAFAKGKFDKKAADSLSGETKKILN